MPTTPITYLYDFDGHAIEVTRRHTGTAVTSSATQRATAYEYGRANVLGIRYREVDTYGRGGANIRYYNLVAEEMKANYRGRRTTPMAATPAVAR